MMSLSIMTFLLSLAYFSLMNLHNPLNFSLKLSILSVMIFLCMSLISSSWFPMILMMLILGGILVIFSILSALMPNEKMKKEKKKILFISLIMSSFFFTMKCSQENIFKFNKSFIEEIPIFLLIMILMLFYFFIFMYFLNLEEQTMRKLTCLNLKNFVNFFTKLSYLSNKT